MRSTPRRALRAAARLALENKGYIVEDVGGLGIVPGGRLRTTNRIGGEETYAVRTSRNRTLSFSYSESSEQWRTLANVDVVLICVEGRVQDTADVIAVTAASIHGELEKLRQPKARTKKLLVVVPLDGTREDGAQSIGLVDRAIWTDTISLEIVRKQIKDGVINVRPKTKSEKDYIEVAREKFAEQNNVEIERVVVLFQILPKT